MKQSQVDTWSIREQLALASAVQSSGDQNWVAVSRTIRMLSTEGQRPQDWYSTKNCALQYALLLEGVSPAKRKRDKDKGSSTADTGTTETPGETLAKMLTKQHLEEVSATLVEDRELYNQLRRELHQLEAGHLDHQLELMWEQMVQEEKEEQEQQQRYEVWAKEREDTIAAIQLFLKPPKVAGVGRKNMVGRPPASHPSSPSDDRNSTTATPPRPAATAQQTVLSPTQKMSASEGVSSKSPGTNNIGAAPPSSPLLSSLLTRATGATGAAPLTQDIVGSSKASVVQNLFSSSTDSTNSSSNTSALQQHAVAGSPTLSRLLELPPSTAAATLPPSATDHTSPEDDEDTKSVSGGIAIKSIKHNTSCDETSLPSPAADDKTNVLIAVNGNAALKQEDTTSGGATCAKMERLDGSSMVIKEDLMMISNKPETECQSSLPLGVSSGSASSNKEGYQETVSSPTLPKTEPKGVWDDMKGCGEVLQLGEVQRKYSRLGHTAKYHHYSSSSSHVIKLEKDSDVDELEEEEDGGFAGFGPSSIGFGSRKIIGSVIGRDDEEASNILDEDEDVYNIDNDDTIGLKATKKRKLMENKQAAAVKLTLVDSEDSCEAKTATNPSSGSSSVSATLIKTEPVLTVGSPLHCSNSSTGDATSLLTAAAAAPLPPDTEGGDRTTTSAATITASALPVAAGAVVVVVSSSKRDMKKQSRSKPKERIDDRIMDFDDCDSVDSLVTSRSSLCGGDSDAGGSSSGASVRGCKRKLHHTTDSLLSSASAVGSPQHFSDASPESPASTNNGDDPDSEKALRSWRKSVMILWNEIAAHKYASVFLRPISEDKVPGYRAVVKRPMDLQTIKRNVENGALRTTLEFQRDIMLMCANALMFNEKKHDVYKMATKIWQDALAKIEEFQSAAGVVTPESPHKTLRRETRESLAKRTDEPAHHRHTKFKKKKKNT